MLVPFLSRDEFEFFQTLEVSCRAMKLTGCWCWVDESSSPTFRCTCESSFLLSVDVTISATARSTLQSGFVIWAQEALLFSPSCSRSTGTIEFQGIVDGDLCEQYVQLESAKQRQVATSLDQASSSLVVKRLEDLRARYAF